VIALWCKHRCLHRCKRRCNGKYRGAVWSRATSSVERRAEAGDYGGGVRTRCSGAGRGASGGRDLEFDLSLAPGSTGGGEWLRAGGGSTGWRWCDSAGDRDRILGQRPRQDPGLGVARFGGRCRGGAGIALYGERYRGLPQSGFNEVACLGPGNPADNYVERGARRSLPLHTAREKITGSVR